MVSIQLKICSSSNLKEFFIKSIQDQNYSCLENECNGSESSPYSGIVQGIEKSLNEINDTTVEEMVITLVSSFYTISDDDIKYQQNGLSFLLYNLPKSISKVIIKPSSDIPQINIFLHTEDFHIQVQDYELKIQNISFEGRDLTSQFLNNSQKENLQCLNQSNGCCSLENMSGNINNDSLKFCNVFQYQTDHKEQQFSSVYGIFIVQQNNISKLTSLQLENVNFYQINALKPQKQYFASLIHLKGKQIKLNDQIQINLNKVNINQVYFPAGLFWMEANYLEEKSDQYPLLHIKDSNFYDFNYFEVTSKLAVSHNKKFGSFITLDNQQMQVEIINSLIDNFIALDKSHCLISVLTNNTISQNIKLFLKNATIQNINSFRNKFVIIQGLIQALKQSINPIVLNVENSHFLNLSLYNSLFYLEQEENQLDIKHSVFQNISYQSYTGVFTLHDTKFNFRNNKISQINCLNQELVASFLYAQQTGKSSFLSNYDIINNTFFDINPNQRCPLMLFANTMELNQTIVNFDSNQFYDIYYNSKIIVKENYQLKILNNNFLNIDFSKQQVQIQDSQQISGVYSNQGLFVAENNNFIYISNNSFNKFDALIGGIVFILSNSNLIFNNNKVQDVKVNLRGGILYSENNNTISFSNNNIANIFQNDSEGGVIFANINNKIEIANNSFSNSTFYIGGIMSLQNENLITLVGNKFFNLLSQKMATIIYSSFQNTINAYNNQIEDISSKQDGGIFLSLSNDSLDFRSNLFNHIKNQAFGAIFKLVSNNSLYFATNSVKNIQAIGSGVAKIISQNRVHFNENTFQKITIQNFGSILSDDGNNEIIFSNNLAIEVNSETIAGVLYLEDRGIISGNSFFNCSSDFKAGIIFINKNSQKELTQIYNNTFNSCSSNENGLIYLNENNSVLIFDNTFYNCSIGGSGGSIFLKNNNSVEIKNITILNQKSEEKGGFSYLDKFNKAHFSNIIVENIEVDISGGFIFLNEGNQILVENVQIINVSSLQVGGVIGMNNFNDLIFKNSLIQNVKIKEVGGLSYMGENNSIQLLGLHIINIFSKYLGALLNGIFRNFITVNNSIIENIHQESNQLLEQNLIYLNRNNSIQIQNSSFRNIGSFLKASSQNDIQIIQNSLNKLQSNSYTLIIEAIEQNYIKMENNEISQLFQNSNQGLFQLNYNNTLQILRGSNFFQIQINNTKNEQENTAFLNAIKLNHIEISNSQITSLTLQGSIFAKIFNFQEDQNFFNLSESQLSSIFSLGNEDIIQFFSINRNSILKLVKVNIAQNFEIANSHIFFYCDFDSQLQIKNLKIYIDNSYLSGKIFQLQNKCNLQFQNSQVVNKLQNSIQTLESTNSNISIYSNEFSLLNQGLQIIDSDFKIEKNVFNTFQSNIQQNVNTILIQNSFEQIMSIQLLQQNFFLNTKYSKGSSIQLKQKELVSKKQLNYNNNQISLSQNIFNHSQAFEGNAINIENIVNCQIFKNQFIQNRPIITSNKQTIMTGGAIQAQFDERQKFNLEIFENKFIQNRADIGGAIYLDLPMKKFFYKEFYINLRFMDQQIQKNQTQFITLYPNSEQQNVHIFNNNFMNNQGNLYDNDISFQKIKIGFSSFKQSNIDLNNLFIQEEKIKAFSGKKSNYQQCLVLIGQVDQRLQFLESTKKEFYNQLKVRQLQLMGSYKKSSFYDLKDFINDQKFMNEMEHLEMLLLFNKDNNNQIIQKEIQDLYQSINFLVIDGIKYLFTLFQGNICLYKAIISNSSLPINAQVQLEFFYEVSNNHLKLDIDFQPCELGSYLDNDSNECRMCPQGWFSNEREFIQSNVCNQCFDNDPFECLGGSKLLPKPGFYIYSNQTTKIFSCPLKEKTCLGYQTNQIFNTSRQQAIQNIPLKCKEGHTGVMCNQCLPKYGKINKNNCQKCSSFQFGIIFIIQLLVVISIFSFSIYSSKKLVNCIVQVKNLPSNLEGNDLEDSQQKNSPIRTVVTQQLETEEQDKLLEINKSSTQLEIEKNQVEEFFNRAIYMFLMKILTTHFQVLAILISLPFNIPQFFIMIAENIRISPDVGSVFSLECIIKNIGYQQSVLYFKLIITHIMPIFLLLICIIISNNMKGKKSDIFRSIQNKFSLVQNIIMYGIIICSFQYKEIIESSSSLFAQINLGDQYFKEYRLHNDFSVQTQTTQYQRWLIAGILLFFGFGILFPIIITFIIIIKYKFTRQSSKRNILYENRSFLYKFGFLYIGYKNQYFFFDAIIYLLKFSLILITTVFSNEIYQENLQFPIMLLLAVIIIYTILILIWNPYQTRFKIANTYQNFSGITLCITCFSIAFYFSSQKELKQDFWFIFIYLLSIITNLLFLIFLIAQLFQKKFSLYKGYFMQKRGWLYKIVSSIQKNRSKKQNDMKQQSGLQCNEKSNIIDLDQFPLKIKAQLEEQNYIQQFQNNELQTLQNQLSILQNKKASLENNTKNSVNYSIGLSEQEQSEQTEISYATKEGQQFENQSQFSELYENFYIPQWNTYSQSYSYNKNIALNGMNAFNLKINGERIKPETVGSILTQNQLINYKKFLDFAKLSVSFEFQEENQYTFGHPLNINIFDYQDENEQENITIVINSLIIKTEFDQPKKEFNYKLSCLFNYEKLIQQDQKNFQIKISIDLNDQEINLILPIYYSFWNICSFFKPLANYMQYFDNNQSQKFLLQKNYIYYLNSVTDQIQNYRFGQIEIDFFQREIILLYKIDLNENEEENKYLCNVVVAENDDQQNSSSIIEYIPKIMKLIPNLISTYAEKESQLD